MMHGVKRVSLHVLPRSGGQARLTDGVGPGDKGIPDGESQRGGRERKVGDALTAKVGPGGEEGRLSRTLMSHLFEKRSDPDQAHGQPTCPKTLMAWI